jgi:outer membrane receptor protein involved in Fe transport
LSEELQFLYETDPLVGVVGLYYFEQNSDDIATVYLNPPPPGVQRDSDNNKVDNSSWAAFTQWTYKFADKFAITVGGRYSEDDKGSYPDQFDYATPNVKQVPVQWYRETFTRSRRPRRRRRLSDNAVLPERQKASWGRLNSHQFRRPAGGCARGSSQEAQTIELGANSIWKDGGMSRGIHPITPTCR